MQRSKGRSRSGWGTGVEDGDRPLDRLCWRQCGLSERVEQIAGLYGFMVNMRVVMGHASRLNELNLDLPPAPKPMGIYKPIVIVGDMAYLSGHGPLCSDGSLMSGCVGGDLDQADGYFAARQTGLAILSTLQQGLGSLDRVLRVVKILGMVHCVPQFDQHPAVIDGCSDLLAELFGSEHGIGARSAVGMSSLPGGMAVEIETVFQVRT